MDKAIPLKNSIRPMVNILNLPVEQAWAIIMNPMTEIINMDKTRTIL